MGTHFEQTLEHAIRGHENAQSVIRFIDEKNAFVVSLSTAFVAAGAMIVEKGLNPPSQGALAALSTLCAGHVAALSLILFSPAIGAVCIVFAAMSVRANRPHDDRSVEHSVLFPCHDRKKVWNAREYYLKTLRDGMEEPLILCEYADQLAIIGDIIFIKCKHHQRSVLLFAWQAAILVAGIVLGLATTTW